MSLTGDTIAHLLHGQSISSRMENPSGRQIGIKVNTLKTNKVSSSGVLV
jgi:hypothetical protein